MVIDFHTHAFPDGLAPRAIEALNAEVPPEARAVLDGTVSDLLRSMDSAGIDRSVIWSIATAPKQVSAIVKWSLQIRSDRIEPFGSVHPDCDDLAAAVRLVAESGLKGIKMHPQYQGFAVDDRLMWPFYEAVQDCGLILGFHAGRDIAFPPEDDRAAPRRILAVHSSFPEMRIVAAHLGGWMNWEEVSETLAGTDVYLETSYTFHCMGDGEHVRRILSAHPTERILFGTDSPWRPQDEELGTVRRMIGDGEALEKVLHRNAERLLNGER